MNWGKDTVVAPEVSCRGVRGGRIGSNPDLGGRKVREGGHQDLGQVPRVPQTLLLLEDKPGTEETLGSLGGSHL